jgi:hypothetical protein
MRADTFNVATAIPPVSLRGKMTTEGYQPENHEWLDVLAPCQGQNRVGRDPLGIETATLTNAGHPAHRTRDILARMGDVPLLAGMTRHKHLRNHCLEMCAENSAAVRRCAIINCPLWAYRMGRNPHNPRRGINPGHLIGDAK